MPILFISDSGLHGDLLFKLISERLPENWHASRSDQLIGDLRHYRALVLDCWQTLLSLPQEEMVDFLEKLNHPKILLINYPADYPDSISEVLPDHSIRWVCDVGADQDTLLKNLSDALNEKGHGNGQDEASGVSLTRREQEILGQLTEGEPNSVIADRLHLSEHTVKNHMYNIFRKLGVKNRLQASNWAKLHLREERT